MRENRLSGSEGGVPERASLPPIVLKNAVFGAFWRAASRRRRNSAAIMRIAGDQASGGRPGGASLLPWNTTMELRGCATSFFNLLWEADCS